MQESHTIHAVWMTCRWKYHSVPRTWLRPVTCLWDYFLNLCLTSPHPASSPPPPHQAPPHLASPNLHHCTYFRTALSWLQHYHAILVRLSTLSHPPFSRRPIPESNEVFIRMSCLRYHGKHRQIITLQNLYGITSLISRAFYTMGPPLSLCNAFVSTLFPYHPKMSQVYREIYRHTAAEKDNTIL